MVKKLLISFSLILGVATYSQTNEVTPDTIVLPKDVSFKELKKTADIFYNRGNYKESLKINIELLKKGLKFKDNYYIHQGYRNLGYDYLELNDTVQAKESFKTEL